MSRILSNLSWAVSLLGVVGAIFVLYEGFTRQAQWVFGRQVASDGLAVSDVLLALALLSYNGVLAGVLSTLSRRLLSHGPLDAYACKLAGVSGWTVVVGGTLAVVLTVSKTVNTPLVALLNGGDNGGAYVLAFVLLVYNASVGYAGIAVSRLRAIENGTAALSNRVAPDVIDVEKQRSYYADLTDEKLLSLFQHEIADIVPAAQRLLRDEVERRGINKRPAEPIHGQTE